MVLSELDSDPVNEGINFVHNVAKKIIASYDNVLPLPTRTVQARARRTLGLVAARLLQRALLLMAQAV